VASGDASAAPSALPFLSGTPLGDGSGAVTALPFLAGVTPSTSGDAAPVAGGFSFLGAGVSVASDAAAPATDAAAATPAEGEAAAAGSAFGFL
jgi:hypothetical protein